MTASFPPLGSWMPGCSELHAFSLRCVLSQASLSSPLPRMAPGARLCEVLFSVSHRIRLPISSVGLTAIWVPWARLWILDCRCSRVFATKFHVMQFKTVSQLIADTAGGPSSFRRQLNRGGRLGVPRLPVLHQVVTSSGFLKIS